MSIREIFRPKPTISEGDIEKGIRWWTREGTVSLGFNSIVTSGFLAAFALALGANNFQIGILAAIPFLLQIIQLPAIWLIEKLRKRKLIAVASWFPAQLIWIVIALIPLFTQTPGKFAISALLLLATIRGFLFAICNAAWNGWIRDLIPQSRLGQLFSRRLAFATVVGVAFSLGAAFFVDYWKDFAAAGNQIFGYTYVLLFGAIFLGLASPTFMTLMPEPVMHSPPGIQIPMYKRLIAPVRHINFRRLMQFLLFWGFASNLAIPFFAIYMLTRLGLPLTWVIGFSILSQIFNLVFFRIWGPLVDRFGSKAVLSLCASLYLFVIFGWIFTTMPERYFLTIPLLIALHIFAGIANAGVTLTVGTIGLKLAPTGEATSYLAGASIATNLGAGLGPLAGGIMADFFSGRQINMTLSWIGPGGNFQIPTLSIIGLDFLFLIAFVIGLITLGTLANLHERGEASREVLLESLMNPMREFSRPLSSVPGYNLISNFPFSYIKRIPVPGLDVALGVTAYQIAEAARLATSATLYGQEVTKKLAQSLVRSLSGIWNTHEPQLQEFGLEIAREVARGAMHAVSERKIADENLAVEIAKGVIEASRQFGIDSKSSIMGASQGIIQGAAETNSDLNKATVLTIVASRQIAVESKISQRLAVDWAIQGALQAAEVISPSALAKVREFENRGDKHLYDNY
ncbi:MAG TPA: MFS transporter [Dehalococcoidia bacterium]|nr:MFS transporter [Dehalococcoidia bacterium]